MTSRLQFPGSQAQFVQQSQANIVTFPHDYSVPMSHYGSPQLLYGNAGSSSQAFVTAPSPSYVYSRPEISGQMGQGLNGTSGFHNNTTIQQPQVQQTMAQPSTSNWYLDSGASTHVTHDLRNLSYPLPCSTGDGVVVGNGSSLPINHTGKGHNLNSYF